ncbi:MAG: elongation factor 1-beta [Nanoarchaeota archaeon]
MGTAIIKLKVMPNSPETNLEAIQKEIERIVAENSGKMGKLEIEPIAFGLKAIIATFTWPEEIETEKFEKAISSINNVSSVQIIDFRRAFG